MVVVVVMVVVMVVVVVVMWQRAGHRRESASHEDRHAVGEVDAVMLNPFHALIFRGSPKIRIGRRPSVGTNIAGCLIDFRLHSFGQDNYL